MLLMEVMLWEVYYILSLRDTLMIYLLTTREFIIPTTVFQIVVGLKGGSGNFSYLLRGSMTDNKIFLTPDGEVDNTWYKENDIQAGIMYESEKFSSDLRLSMNSSRTRNSTYGRRS